MDTAHDVYRYRSYTTYSEENGKLVPSIEPREVIESVKLVDIVTGKEWSSGKEKLKTDTLPNNVEPKPLTNVTK